MAKKEKKRNIHPEVASLVNRRIEELGLSNTKIAERFKVTPQAVSGWRNRGEIGKHYIFGLAKLLQVRPMDLVPKEEKWSVLSDDELLMESIVLAVEEFEAKHHRTLPSNIRARAITTLFLKFHGSKSYKNAVQVSDMLTEMMDTIER